MFISLLVKLLFFKLLLRRLRGNLCDFWENVADCTKDGLRVDAVRSLPEIATLPVPQPQPSELDIETIGIDAGMS